MATQVLSGRFAAVMTKHRGLPYSSAATFPTTPAVNTVFSATASITATSTTPAMASGDMAICTSVDPIRWLKINSETGIYADTPVGSKVDIMVLIANLDTANLSDSATTVENVKFGTVYSENIPTTMSWSASCSGHVNYVQNHSQVMLLEAYLSQREIEAYFFMKIGFTAGKIDETKSVIRYGNAFISSFSSDIAAADIATLSMDLTGNGALNAIVYGKTVSTDWDALASQ